MPLLRLLQNCYCYFCHRYHYFHIILLLNTLLQILSLSGAVELTTQLLILENILWLPLCRINKFGLNTLPSKLLRSPILVGYHYIVEFIHDSTENYYEGGIYACRNCNNIKFHLHVLKVLKSCLFCLPMLVDSCSNKLFDHKIPMHRKWVRLKCASHILHDALFMFQFLSFMWASLKSSCLARGVKR